MTTRFCAWVAFILPRLFLERLDICCRGLDIMVDIMVEADARLCGTATKIISEKEYYTMLRAHTMVQKYIFPASNNPVVTLVNVMTFIQNYQHLESSTFHELKDKYIKLHLSIIPDNCNCVHFVGDRYNVSSELGFQVEESKRKSKISCSKMR